MHTLFDSTDLFCVSNSSGWNVPNAAQKAQNDPQGNPAVQRYQSEADQYRAFLVGQQQEQPQRTQAMSQGIDRWEEEWRRMGEGGKSNGGGSYGENLS